MSAIARAVAACAIAQIVGSPSLWFGDGWLAPLSGVFGTTGAAIGTIAIVLAAGLVLARPRSQVALGLFGALLFVRAAPDRALWQAYVLEHVAIAGVLASARDDAQARLAVRWILGLTFTWAGLHKLNPAFLASGLEPLGRVPSASHGAFAVLEASLGAMLLGRRFRAAAIALVVFSIGVAVWLIAVRTNRAVVPWNLAHAVVLAVLARDRQAARTPRAVLAGDRQAARTPRALLGAIAIVFGVLPAAYPLGWPAYLSSRLYTANSARATLYVDDARRLPAAARRLLRPDRAEVFAHTLDLQWWTHAVSGAYLSPDVETFEAVLRNVCRRAGPQAKPLLVVQIPREYWRSPRTVYRRCEAIADAP